MASSEFSWFMWASAGCFAHQHTMCKPLTPWKPYLYMSSPIWLQNRFVFSSFSAQLQPTEPLEGTSTLQKKAVSQSFLPKPMRCSRELPHSFMTSHTHITVLVTGQEEMLLPCLGTSLYQVGIWRADISPSPWGNSSLHFPTNYTEFKRKTWKADIWNVPKLSHRILSSFSTHLHSRPHSDSNSPSWLNYTISSCTFVSYLNHLGICYYANSDLLKMLWDLRLSIHRVNV